jgi:acetylglutamate kinase
VSVIVVKVGGHALEATSDAVSLLDALASDIRDAQESGTDVVLVHGGGPQISELLTATGVESSFVNGLRVTDEPTLRAVVMGLSIVNATLCAALGARGLSAVGCSGTSAGLISAEASQEELGFVGSNVTVEPSYLSELLTNGHLPVVAPFGMDPQGQLLNCNADAVAGALAGALHADSLLLLSDIDQVRTDADDATTGTASMTALEARGLLESGNAQEGMRPKLESCIAALAHGARRVVIANGSRPHAVRDVLNKEALQTEVVA